MTKKDRRHLLVFLVFVAPGVLLYLFIVTYPVIYSGWLSLTDFNPNTGGTGNWVGLKMYKTMFSDPLFWHSLKNTITVVMISAFGQIPAGFILAFILFRRMIKGGPFFQAMVFLPQFLSTIVIGLLWKRMFSADGPVAGLIQFISGDPQAQFTMMLEARTVMIPVAFALIWVYTGLYMIIFLANLQKIDVSIIEAAKIDGASEPQIFMRIVVPILSGTILVSTILAIAGSLKGFDLIFAMTTQGLQRNNAMVMAIFMYQTAFQDYRNPLRFAYGAAISNTIVLISAALIIIANWIGKKLSPTEVA